ncbi:MAG TPA: cyclic pyranopterin monophosphate synthase MoaC [Acidimicrobiales bacterium]|nr:cyclic pyranopterin monophosphate synthase MoaC [Acidimicrobiales bacterium]
MSNGDLTHLDGRGRARMVDVTAKPVTNRSATARCRVLGESDLGPVLGRHGALADVVEAAKVAGRQAAKATWRLIPLCHPIELGEVLVTVAVGRNVEISATAKALDRTGVEMEALTACAVAALSIITACVEDDPTVHLDGLAVFEKTGGRSGHWRREADGSVTNSPA